MAGSLVRNCMAQIKSLLVSHFILGNYYKPKEFTCGYFLSHKIIEIVAKKKMKPIGLNQIVRCDFISTFLWDGSDKKDFAKDS